MARRYKKHLLSCGTVVIEYAFLLPVLLLFILGILDIGRLIWTQTTLTRAAEAAARCGAVNTITCATAAEIQSYAVTQAYGLTISASAFTVPSANCGTQVVASFPFVFVVPWIASSTITLSAISCYPP